MTAVETTTTKLGNNGNSFLYLFHGVIGGILYYSFSQVLWDDYPSFRVCVVPRTFLMNTNGKFIIAKLGTNMFSSAV